jgi:hypothetical protein
MSGKIADLPNRFPVGTRFVIEGLGGRISSRFIEFPDGRKVNLPADLAARAKSPGRRRSLTRRT